MKFTLQSRRSIACLFILIILGFSAFGAYLFKLKKYYIQIEHSKTTVLYSQTDDIPEVLIQKIQESKQYVYVAMYTLTQEDLVDALIAAKLKGLDVKVVLDYSQSLNDTEKPHIAKLKKYNIAVHIPFRTSGIMHIKLLLTDTTYASGSFNWTNSASTINDEIIEIGNNQALHKRYSEIFQRLYKL